MYHNDYFTGEESAAMQHDDYLKATTELLGRYTELSQYIRNVKADMEEIKRALEEDTVLSAISYSPTSGCSKAASSSTEERAAIRHDALCSKLYECAAKLQRVEPLIKRMDRSLEALGSLSPTKRRIIEDRYIYRASWESTARRSCCSVGYCRKEAGRALEILSTMIFGADALPFQLSLPFHKDR